MASKLEINQSLIAKWESGKVQPRAATLQKLSQVLEVDQEELLAGDYGKVSMSLRSVDPKLVELFGQVHQLEQPDREALRRVLEAMLTRSRVHDAIAQAMMICQRRNSDG